MANPLDITLADIPRAPTQDAEGDPDGELQSLVDEAVRMLLSKRRNLPTWIAAGTVSIEDARDVVWRAVERVNKNTGGLKSEHEGTYGYEVHALAAAGYLWFPAEDLDQVTPQSKNKAAGTARVTPTPGWRGW